MLVVAIGREHITIYLFSIVLAFSLFAALARPTFSLFANALFVTCMLLVFISLEFPELLVGKIPASLQIWWRGIAMLFGCALGTSTAVMFVRKVKPDLLLHWGVLDAGSAKVESRI